MAKAITQEQHDALHGIWPNNCCLCRLEEGNAALKARIEELEKRLEAADRLLDRCMGYLEGDDELRKAVYAALAGEE